MTVEVLTAWRTARAAAFTAAADALAETLVAIDATRDLLPDTRAGEVRNVEATYRDAIRENREAADDLEGGE